jgi:hypothetical protein
MSTPGSTLAELRSKPALSAGHGALRHWRRSRLVGARDCGVRFDTACVRRLYQYGYQKAWSGRFWQTRPPSPDSNLSRSGDQEELWAGLGASAPAPDR